MNGRTPRYLECQFEDRSEPVSVGAGMLLLGGGVGMVAEVWFVYLVGVVLCRVFGYILELSHANGGLSHQCPRKSGWRLVRAIP